MNTFEPFDWTVVIGGSWNPAILTPGGIATRLYQLHEDTSVEVQVPINCLGPPRVVHDGLVVTVSSTRLVIGMDTCNNVSMEKALKVARVALNALPETPVSAAGYNIRYKGSAQETTLPDMTQATTDAFSDGGLIINSQGILAQLKHEQGVVNLKAVVSENNTLDVELNFHRASVRHVDLLDWLDISMEEVDSAVLRVAKSIAMPLQEGSYVGNI